MRTDTERLDWLAMRVLIVRTPLRYGSRAEFTTQPPDVDGAPPEHSNLRAHIDAALDLESTSAPAAPVAEVRIPRDEQEAALMALLGINWLSANAPHRLRTDVPDIKVVGGGFPDFNDTSSAAKEATTKLARSLLDLPPL